MAQPYRRKTGARRELCGVQRLRGGVSHGRDAAGTGKQRLHPLLKMRARLSKTRALRASFARSQPLSSPPQMQRYDRVLLAKIAADAVKGRLEGAITQKMRKSCVKFLKHGHSCDTIII